MSGFGRFWPHIVGEGRKGGYLVVTTVALLVLLSGGFVLGIQDIGFSFGWVVVAVGIAILAGAIQAGLGPTIGSLWLFGLWWFVFPPLVGYLTGNWETASRYTYPRILDYGHTSAYAELVGGIENGVRSGLLFALLVGTVGYVIGIAVARASKRVDEG